MNTIGSVYYGWAWLILCGGGSYYFAKRSINADRADRQAQDLARRRLQSRQVAAATHPKPSPPLSPSPSPSPSEMSVPPLSPGASAAKGAKPPENSSSNGKRKVGMEGEKKHEAAHTPSGEASADPAAAPARGRGQGGESGQVEVESKYEAVTPFRSQKGDRFS